MWLLALLLLASPAQAQVTGVSVSVASHHVSGERWNEFNPGLHLTFDNQWRVGVYENSRSGRVHSKHWLGLPSRGGELIGVERHPFRATAYGGRVWSIRLHEWVAVSSVVGVAVGEGQAWKSVGWDASLYVPVPMGAVSLAVGPRALHVELSALPSGAIAVSASADF